MNYRDCVEESSVSVGLGDFFLTGAVTGFTSFSAVGVLNGEVLDYSIRHQSMNEWEVGSGTYNAGPNSITRGTVTRSSAGNGIPVNFSAGNKIVVLTLSERLMNKLANLSGGPGVLGITGSSGEPQLLKFGGGIVVTPDGTIIPQQVVSAVFVEEGEDTYSIPGPPGPAGASGSQGVQGAPGVSVMLEPTQQEDAMQIPGPPGPAGAAGSPGTQGAPGVSLLIEPELGEDTYPIPGPQGNVGATGATGPQGLQGNPGLSIYVEPEKGEDFYPIPGPQGNVGIAGPQGIQGVPGLTILLDPDTGEDRLIIPGPQGNVGATGPQGIQGAIGVSLMREPEFPEDIVMISPPTPGQGLVGSLVVVGGAADVTGTITFPPWATFFEIEAIRAGDGGGSGRKGAASTLRNGGNGGDGGPRGGRILFRIADFGGAPLFYSVGKWGAGGAAQTTNSTNGLAGGAANRLFVSKTNSAGNLLYNIPQCSSGIGGLGGNNASGGNGLNGNASFALQCAEIGGIGGEGAASASQTQPTSTYNAGAGGDFGQCINASNVLQNPCVSAVVYINTLFGVGTGVVITNTVMGGTGGFPSNNTAGAAGNPGSPYGGGGSGGNYGIDGTVNSGAGGDGGAGILRITWW